MGSPTVQPAGAAMKRYTSVFLGLVIATAPLSCDNSPTELLQLHNVEFLAGEDQSGVVGKELAEPLRVRAVDANGNPIAGQVLNFRVVSGGGSVFAGAASTNSDGVAQERWT